MLAVSRQVAKSSVRCFATYPEAWTKIATKELKGDAPCNSLNRFVIL